MEIALSMLTIKNVTFVLIVEVYGQTKEMDFHMLETMHLSESVNCIII